MITDETSNSNQSNSPINKTASCKSDIILNTKTLSKYGVSLSKEMKSVKSKLKQKNKVDKFIGEMDKIVDKLMTFDRSELPLRIILMFVCESVEHYLVKRKSGASKLDAVKSVMKKHIRDDELLDEMIHTYIITHYIKLFTNVF